MNTDLGHIPHDSKNNIFSIIHSVYSTLALRAAYKLNFFEIINKHRALTTEEIINILKIPARGAQVILSMCSSLELIFLNANNKFELSETAQDYLLKESPFYIGNLLDINGSIINADNPLKKFEKAILEDKPQQYDDKDLFDINEENVAFAKDFTQSMHTKSAPYADIWPTKINLSQSKIFLDIGGGSGIHSMSAVRHWPQLNAIIYDRQSVCDAANDYVSQNYLQNKIKTQAGNMFKEQFPTSDVHFYCDILHDWPMDTADLLIQKSHETLENNGRIIILEMLFDDNKTGPLQTAIYNALMAFLTKGQQFSGKEIKDLLKKNSFVNIEIIPIMFGDWHLITAQKIA